MNTNVPILKFKWLEIYFGIFGPALTYHTNGYEDDNARLVISLIFIKLYITLPWKGFKDHTFEMYKEYGFYFTNEPVHQLVWRWGSTYKTICMPWAMVTHKITLLDKNSQPGVVYLYADKYFDMRDAAMSDPDKYHRVYNDQFKYFVEEITLVPLVFRWLKLEWFKKIKYSVNVTKDTYIFMGFTTDNNICLPEQINLQFEIHNMEANNKRSEF